MPATDETGRPPFGVPGLDEVFHDGIPPDSLVLVEGPPGSGKTTLGLQFLLQGVRDGETCLLLTNAESPGQLERIAASHGWSLEGLHVVDWNEPADHRPGNGGAEYTLFPEAEVEVGETLRVLFAEIERLRPTRLVIDTISLLRLLAPSPAFHRRQLRRIREAVAGRSCATLVIDDAQPTEKGLRGQTLVDGVVELTRAEFLYGGDRRQLRVRKLRGATYIGGAHDMKLIKGGLVVYPRLVAAEHATVDGLPPAVAGLEALDRLAGAGLPRGSSTLVAGPAGTGKSTLCAAYASAAARRGERCAVYLFDETPESFLARAEKLGLGLASAAESGRLFLRNLDPAELTPGEIAHRIVHQVKEDGVRLVVIDTVNGYLQSAAEEPMVMLHLRELLSFLGRSGVVTLLVLTQHGLLAPESAMPVDLSYMADNIFLLRFFEMEGGVRKALSVVKRRSGPHETTIRELCMTERGITLSPPLKEFSRVLGERPRYHVPAGPDAS
ncbi:MAG TPA: ATPase domain-containing protein [Pelomicrobium sp.]|nr:ATPase domain-containing protein [Pelomicrobium sp.]